MPTGLFTVCPGGSFGGPIALSDDRLRSGPVALLDLALPARPWDSDASPLLIPNIAAGPLSAMLGGNLDAAKNFVVDNSMGSVSGAWERTAKGGLHVLVSRAGATDSTRYAVQLSPQAAAYLAANSGHNYYIGLWGRITRRNSSGAAVGLGGIHVDGTGANVGLGLIQPSSGNIASTPNSGLLGRVTATLTDGVGLFRADVADNGLTSSAVTVNIARFGHHAPVNQGPSWVLYCLTIEDLTVSGRNYAAASAADAAAYAVAFGEGGRYADDSWTDPETVYPTP